MLEEGDIVMLTGGGAWLLEEGDIATLTGGGAWLLEEGDIATLTGGGARLLEDGNIVTLTEEDAWLLEDATALDDARRGIIDDAGTSSLKIETTLAENTGGGVLLGINAVALVGRGDELGCGALDGGSISESCATEVGSGTPSATVFVTVPIVDRVKSIVVVPREETGLFKGAWESGSQAPAPIVWPSC